MSLPYYCIFENGQTAVRDAKEFRLHDSRAAFDAFPRVFTSFLCEKTEAGLSVFGLRRHIERVLRDAAAFRLLDPSHPEHHPEWIEEQLGALLPQLGEPPLRVRLVVSKRGLEIQADTFAPRWQKGAAISLVSFRGERPWPEHKTTATEVCVASHEYALARGAEEALLIGEDGRVLEGSWSNFFWFDSAGTLFTRGDGVLPGVTRGSLFERIPVTFRTVTLPELFEAASEAFISQSTQAVTPVKEIDGRKLPGGAPGANTRRILDLAERNG